MATAPTIDIDAILAPIPGDPPSGRCLTYEPEYQKIRESRQTEDDLDRGEWDKQRRVADWPLVIRLCTECLTHSSKDLQVAAWLADALTRQHRYAGLRDGFRLLEQLQERFWECYYPEIEDGDLESRYGPFLFLNDPNRLPLTLSLVPLTQGIDGERYSYADFLVSRDTDNRVRKNPEMEDELRAEGRITGEDFDRAVAQTSLPFYEDLLADLREARDAFAAFEESTDQRFGRDAPSLLNLRKALASLLELLESIVLKKGGGNRKPAKAVDDIPDNSDGARETSAPGRRVASVASDLPATDRDDQGRVLMDFLAGAEELVEVGAKLRENRRRHAELVDELRQLDEEYSELASICPEPEFFSLLDRLLDLQPQWRGKEARSSSSDSDDSEESSDSDEYRDDSEESDDSDS